MVGSKVQHYQLLEKLGAGGMGEIYRAQDTRLNRFVAIKVLTGSTTGDPDRRRRFIQEAQAASALNHPNIITIHDILNEGDAQFMVMEHVQGKTLADLIPKGGMRVPQVLKIAMQMTDALQAAHAVGIVHRDLKPGNVMVTESGLVKVLDFGLAKLTDPGPIANDDATRTIANAPLTVEGSIVGTVSYMSPEQAQGQKVDTRSDVFSLGVVLYEMITGARAFQGDTTVGTLTAILRDEPKPILEVAPDVPPRMADVVAQCLKKVPDDRFQSMRDMHMAMGALKHESDSGVLYRSMLASQIQVPPVSAVKPAAATTASEPAPSKNKMFMMIGGGVVAVGAVVGAVLFMRSPAPEPAPPPPTPVAVVTPAPEPPPEPKIETLNNDGIIQMVTAKVPADVIYNQMRSTPTDFKLTATEIGRLSQAGVSSSMIEAMRDPKNIPAAKASKTPDTAAKASPTPSAPAPPPAASTTAKSAPKGTPATPPPSAPVSSPPPVTAAAPAVVPTPVPTAVAPKAEPGGTSKPVVLTDASVFMIALAEAIPESAKPGTPVRFTVVKDVKVGDNVVIPKGAAAMGEITQGKRMFGKMMLKFTTVTAVDGKTHTIRALSARTSKEPERAVETNVKPKGDKVVADAGTEYTAYVDTDMTVTVRAK